MRLVAVVVRYDGSAEDRRCPKGGPVPSTYYVYMLHCAGGSLYTGITTDVVRRLREHLSGAASGARYTRVHPPLGLAALWTAPDRASASRLEYRIKRLTPAGKRALLACPERVSALVGEAGQGAHSEDELLHEVVPQQERERLWQAASMTYQKSRAS
jgi:putative endonuclease